MFLTTACTQRDWYAHPDASLSLRMLQALTFSLAPLQSRLNTISLLRGSIPIGDDSINVTATSSVAATRDRPIEDTVIVQNGDVWVAFAHPDPAGQILRYCVSSQILSIMSPI